MSSNDASSPSSSPQSNLPIPSAFVFFYTTNQSSHFQLSASVSVALDIGTGDGGGRWRGGRQGARGHGAGPGLQWRVPCHLQGRPQRRHQPGRLLRLPRPPRPLHPRPPRLLLRKVHTFYMHTSSSSLLRIVGVFRSSQSNPIFD